MAVIYQVQKVRDQPNVLFAHQATQLQIVGIMIVLVVLLDISQTEQKQKNAMHGK